MSFEPDPDGHFRPARPNSPQVLSGTWQGRPAVLKSYAHCHPLYRLTVGRLAISREWWALNLLQNSGRVPVPLHRPEPWTVIMELVVGTPIEDLEEADPGAMLAESEVVLRSLELAGVVHADLGHDFWADMGRESNLIWTEDGRMVALDFSSSLPLLTGRTPWARLTQALRRHDQLLPTKLLHHFGRPEQAGHPAWRLPAQMEPGLWNLLRLLGKI